MSRMYQLYQDEKRQFIEAVHQSEALVKKSTRPLGPGMPGTEIARLPDLPELVRSYLEMAGFNERPLPKVAEVIWKESRIKLGPDKPWMAIKTKQCNTASPTARIAFMSAKMFGVLPFEGRDLYAQGRGHMLGKIAGLATVFDDQSEEIAKSGVVTVLAEAFLIPGILMLPGMTLESRDSLSIKARLTDQGLTAEGVFSFNAQGEVTSFVSEDRYYANPKGGNERRRWTAYSENYIEKDGVRFPSTVRAVWNLPEGDFEYWSGTIERVVYDL
ncbi:DUF6544 family protein [Acidaminobacter hydrogenoformans]|uniref:Uncharacterized protein n=1 Tax=Acidaminobacter hydrogenoformans DSM 2784 TaxID=1120920 RepID=A0A1G5RYS5_9FIRM|nr:DUF6544 family protein [Acidaminobacter hydrogenoformans]SCZ79295.1 hypothetical protein SAMN03080599_01682 [Acidaminobacter hydrogenoformans DSM 2784]